MAIIYHPKGVSSLHHDGAEYKANRKGEFEVPDAAVHQLRGHGFLLASERPAKGPAKEADAAEGTADGAPEGTAGAAS